MNHEILKKLIRKYISCEKTLILLDKIVDSYSEEDGDGIPIGNLTSQIFANLYLNELDHFVVDMGLNYFRYMDDFLIIEPDKEKLIKARDAICEFVKQELKLELHPSKQLLQRTSLGIDFCGYNIFAGRTILRKKTVRRFVRRFKGRQKKIEKLERELGGLLAPELNPELGERIQTLKADLEHSVLSHCGFLKYSEMDQGENGNVLVNKIRLPYLPLPKKVAV